MAAAHDLVMEEEVNLNMDREMKEELEEKEKVREAQAGKEPFKNKKVHRIVSKWMLPEPVRRTYLERANCLPPPVFIISISLAELAVFIYYAVWKPQKQWITLDTGILDSPFIYSPEKREEAWRFVSYMLVHAGVQHILGNLVMQLILGIPLEMVHKGLRVGLVYLAGVIAGSLASSIFDPLKSLVGASGGVYALMGGYFMNVLVNFREMIPAFGIVRLLIIILIILSDMGFALYRRFFVPANGSPMSRKGNGFQLMADSLMALKGTESAVHPQGEKFTEQVEDDGGITSGSSNSPKLREVWVNLAVLAI
nr:rhomboid-related protein 2 isoform X1 [Vicugna pacos]XP_031539926.1 rhomboid-related protein 2 isoform X1 [Vicugna pacos]XP_031539927.1 rhomboid-related protein 2 isoform X1 [Vicugna pacos]XP_031539928.1 rhomboid-related protein 2 isoform X1 [Vicugna pacos]XP_031539929.1 rhomboid-related protein 2 isoform X1 [Vicugna pacos]